MNMTTNDNFQLNLKKLVLAHKMYSRYINIETSDKERTFIENKNLKLIDANCKINKQDKSENYDIVWLKLPDNLKFRIKSSKKINLKQHILNQFSKLRIVDSMSKLKNAFS